MPGKRLCFPDSGNGAVGADLKATVRRFGLAPFRHFAERTFFRLFDRADLDECISFLVRGHERLIGNPVGGENAGPSITIEVHRARFFSRCLAYGNLGLAESFIDEDFSVKAGSLESFLTILLRGKLDRTIRSSWRMLLKAGAIRAIAGLRGVRRNVQSHYDLGHDLFEAFLDRTLTYSCGYASSPDVDLDRLQFDKSDRICRKLRLQPDERLLDIGCGYGGLLIHAAKHYGVTGIGVTISRQHWEFGNARIDQEGLAGRLRIEYGDYCSLAGVFDKVVSVGMIEHVPRRQHDTYFKTIARSLAPHGVGLVHGIGCTTDRNVHDPFIQRYIFPGSNQPRLSEIARQLERNRLVILDVENLVRHYAVTVRRWLERFRSNRDALRSGRYDEAFLKMWEYYLSCGVAAATASDSAVFQVLFTKDTAGNIPLQRV